MAIMGQVKISVFGCIVSFVLLLQLGLHTQLLQRRSGVLEYGNSTDELTDQYADIPPFSAVISTSTPTPSKIMSAIAPITRNKRFLETSRFGNGDDGNPNSGSDATSEEMGKRTDTEEEVTLLKVPESSKSNDIEMAGGTGANTLAAEPDPWDGVSPDLRISNFYTGNFILPNAQLCSKKSDNLTLVVLIPSAVANFQQRQSVRRTWGSFSLRKDVAVGFVIGDPNLSQTNSSVMDSFNHEIDLFGDIIIADFKDSYRNLTLKALYMIEWTSRYCGNARFFMKTDDDVFLNVPLVLQFISRIRESDTEQPKIYGNVFSGHLPQRNVTHKHYVRYEVYPHNVHYPNFTSGPAYLISTAVLRPLLKEAVRLPLFNLEDVFLTGFAASALDIPRINVTQFRNELENPFDMSACKLVNTIAGMTDGSPTQIYNVWYNYLMGTILCKHLKRHS